MADQARVRVPVRRRRKRGDLVVVPVEWSLDGTARVRLWRPDDGRRVGRDPAPYVWGWSERFGLVASDAAALRVRRGGSGGGRARSDVLESCDAAWVPMVRVVRLAPGAAAGGGAAEGGGEAELGGVVSMSSSLDSSLEQDSSSGGGLGRRSIGRSSRSSRRSSEVASRRRVGAGMMAAVGGGGAGSGSGSVLDGGSGSERECERECECAGQDGRECIVDPSEIVRAMTPQQRRRVSRMRAMQSAFLDAYAACGVARAAAQISGVPLQYHYEWLRDPEYSSRFAMAQEEAIQRLEAEAVRRAVEGIERPIYYRGRKVGSQREYSDMLLMFLLRAARPQKYRDQQKIEHQVTGAGGGPIDLRSTQIDIASLPIELVESLARIGAEIRARTATAGGAAGMLPGDVGAGGSASGRVIDGVLSDSQTDDDDDADADADDVYGACEGEGEG